MVENQYDTNDNALHLNANGTLNADEVIQYFKYVDEQYQFSEKVVEHIHFTVLTGINFLSTDVLALINQFELSRHGEN
ncbi:MAG: hypothetical protein V2I33_10530 [Kangiellaceae bacterium]|jgi:hypothetical protein|nr:hypothetical protein [Kangiellaceae bacterium]